MAKTGLKRRQNATVVSPNEPQFILCDSKPKLYNPLQIQTHLLGRVYTTNDSIHHLHSRMDEDHRDYSLGDGTSCT